MLTGGCQCGAVRYRVDAPVEGVYCCHCTECRAQSASAYGISVVVPVAALAVTAGRPRMWSRPTPAGRLDCAFCPDCGTRLWHADDPPRRTMSLKGGSIDGGVDLTGAAHIWTRSRLPGVGIPPDAETWPEGRH